MSHTQFVDELVREYLCHRGFIATLKSLDYDLKNDKDKGFRIDRILDHILQNVHNYDLNALRETWNHLETKLFCKLEHHFTQSLHKLENALYKFYLVHASANNKQEKIVDFFTKMTPELMGQSEWKDWFVLPFVKNPEENVNFAVYFTRQWQDTLFVSLHNLLAAIYNGLQQPTLTNFEEDATKMSNLQRENELLKQELTEMISQDEKEVGHEIETVQDDFYYITQELKVVENQSKMLRSIMRGISSIPSSSKPQSSSLEENKRHSNKKVKSHNHSSKRSLSTDSRSAPGRVKARDSSLDTRRVPSKLSDHSRLDEGNLLFLSQEEYVEHKSSITDVKINSHGNIVASASEDGSVRVWSISLNYKTLYSFNNISTITCLQWLPDGDSEILLSGDSIGRIQAHNVKNSEVVWMIDVGACCKLNEPSIQQMGINVNILLVLACGKTFIFDTNTKKLERVSSSSFHVSCFHVWNQNLILAGTGGHVEIIDILKNQIIKRYNVGREHDIIQIHGSVDPSMFYFLNQQFMLVRKSFNLTEDCLFEINLPKVDFGVSKSRHLFAVDQAESYMLTLGFNSGSIYKVSPKPSMIKCLELGGHRTTITCLDWTFANQCTTCVTASQDGSIKISTLLVESN